MKKAFFLLMLALLAMPASAQQVSKERWLEGMQEILPPTLCSKAMYFRKCFKVTADECLDKAVQATGTCLDKVKARLPAQLNQPDDGAKWGREVGQCTGEALERSMMAKRIDSSECNAGLK